MRKEEKVNPVYPYEIGKNYMFLTVTRYYTGTLVDVTPTELVISNAAWVAHTDRYSNALNTGVLRSVEPIPGQVILGRGGMIEISEWTHTLPKDVK